MEEAFWPNVLCHVICFVSMSMTDSALWCSCGVFGVCFVVFMCCFGVCFVVFMCCFVVFVCEF